MHTMFAAGGGGAAAPIVMGPDSLGAHEIYERITSGPGAGSIVDAQSAARTLSHRYEQRAAEIDRLIQRMDAAWTGEAGAGAHRGAHPLHTWMQDARSNLEQAGGALDDQAHAFHEVFSRVRPVPPEPPHSGVVNNLIPWETDLDRQIQEYKDTAHDNISAYNTYYFSSKVNAERMPAYSTMHGKYGEVAVNNLPGSGDADGVPTLEAELVGTFPTPPGCSNAPPEEGTPTERQVLTLHPVPNDGPRTGRESPDGPGDASSEVTPEREQRGAWQPPRTSGPATPGPASGSNQPGALGAGRIDADTASTRSTPSVNTGAVSQSGGSEHPPPVTSADPGSGDGGRGSAEADPAIACTPDGVYTAPEDRGVDPATPAYSGPPSDGSTSTSGFDGTMPGAWGRPAPSYPHTGFGPGAGGTYGGASSGSGAYGDSRGYPASGYAGRASGGYRSGSYGSAGPGSAVSGGGYRYGGSYGSGGYGAVGHGPGGYGSASNGGSGSGTRGTLRGGAASGATARGSAASAADYTGGARGSTSTSSTARPFMGGAGAGRGNGEEDSEHERKYLYQESGESIFGTDELTPPPVIGE